MNTKKSTILKLDKDERNHKYNSEAINLLIDKYGFGDNYIKKCIRGERNGIIPVRIKEEYNKLESAARTAMLKKAESLKKVELK